MTCSAFVNETVLNQVNNLESREHGNQNITATQQKRRQCTSVTSTNGSSQYYRVGTTTPLKMVEGADFQNYIFILKTFGKILPDCSPD